MEVRTASSRAIKAECASRGTISRRQKPASRHPRAVKEFARERSVPRFVFASSAIVYGRTPTELPVSEERALHPSSVYSASKIAGEALLEAYCRHTMLLALAWVSQSSTALGVERHASSVT
ncbi:NAD-dependent epimerase/dehydratase family protein [Mesorhizobium sp.]|uniref:NAD-dependent epimerase/dehydratase family protein n=1 Tax=Mesorhizobium sp. TaxID=1871066 RepID=UPI000FE96388|nr:MAG: NAD-dependent epimerase/dehydratase family protein [Mesorhizobium sp.]